jgi:hypothetical protein
VQINHAMPELERLQTAQHTPKQPSHELLRLTTYKYAMMAN